MNWSPQSKRESEELRKAAKEGAKAGEEAARILAGPIAEAFAKAEKTVAYWKELAELAQLEIHAIRDRIWKAVEHLAPDQNSPTDLLCALLVGEAEAMRQTRFDKWAELDTAIKAVCEKHGIQGDSDNGYFRSAEECVEELIAKLVGDGERMDWLQANAFKFGTLQGSHYFGQPPTFRSIREIIDGLRKQPTPQP